MLELLFMSTLEIEPEWRHLPQHPEVSYLVLGDCWVPVPDKKLTDYCYIDKKTKEVCGTDPELGENCAK